MDISTVLDHNKGSGAASGRTNPLIEESPEVEHNFNVKIQTTNIVAASDDVHSSGGGDPLVD